MCTGKTLAGFQLSSHSRSFLVSSELVVLLKPMISSSSMKDFEVVGVWPNPKLLELIKMAAVGELGIESEAIGYMENVV